MQKVESELLFLKGYSVQLNDACSDYFTFEMLFHCSDTWLRVQCPNLPLQVESWQAYRELAIEIWIRWCDNTGNPGSPMVFAALSCAGPF